MSVSPNQRNTIDQEVFKWVVGQQKKQKLVTPNAIRQRAFEIGQQFDPNFKASFNWYNNWKKRYDYSESPEAEALKHRKRSYTAAFKLHAVQRCIELESASQAALELDVSRRCLQRWKEELDVIASVAEHSSNAVYRRPGQGRKVVNSSLDKEILDWLQENWKQGVNVTPGMVRQKAREVSNTPTFKASLGWFIKWQKRHNVDLKEQTFVAPATDTSSPLKLRLLPEGEVSCYSTPLKKRKVTKRKLSYNDEVLLENDEEFDRLLLTWLVERWEAGDIVTDRMLKDKALEITTNSEFKATKAWLTAWKGKYNVSLENQTYGNDGEEENEEIIEATEVYDSHVIMDSQQQQQEGGVADTNEGNPLSPTKAEAASALASLSGNDREAAGLEIAEALQKLANAFGTISGNIMAQSGETAKEAMAHLTAAYQADNPEFILEGAGQVAVEEIVSEEVITDEPMVVIETDGSSAQIPPTSSSAPVVSTLSSQVFSSAPPAPAIDTVIVTQPSTSDVDQTPSLSTATTVQSMSGFVSEVVIGEPVVEMSTSEAQVEVLVQGSDGIMVFTAPDVLHSDSTTDSVSVGSNVVLESTAGIQSPIVTELVSQPSESSVVEIVQHGEENPVVVEEAEISVQSSEHVATETIEQSQNILTAQESELLDIVQETVAWTTPNTDVDLTPTKPQRVFDKDFKVKFASCAKELGSVEQAAKELDIPLEVAKAWKPSFSRGQDNLKE